MEEVGKEHYPLMGPGGGDELPLIWEPVCDVVGQVSDSPQLLDVSLREEETIHLPPALDMVVEG